MFFCNEGYTYKKDTCDRKSAEKNVKSGQFGLSYSHIKYGVTVQAFFLFFLMYCIVHTIFIVYCIKSIIIK